MLQILCIFASALAFSEKRRVPAWCDRILYWTRDKNVKLQQKTYSSQSDVTFSDHKPVTSLFALAVKQVDPDKRLAIYDEMLKETDKRANNLLPSISLSQTEVRVLWNHFGRRALLCAFDCCSLSSVLLALIRLRSASLC